MSYRIADARHAAEERGRVERERAGRVQALRERIQRATGTGGRTRSKPSDVAPVSLPASPRNLAFALGVTLFVLACLFGMFLR